MMSLPRCGVNDNVKTGINTKSKRFVLGESRWVVKELTYRISKYSTKLGNQEVDEVIARAFNVWSKHIDLIFTASAYAYPVDIDIRFEEYVHDCQYSLPFDGPLGEFGHAAFPSDNAFVHFDDSENWTIENSKLTDINLFHIAIHEFGHALGLDHSDVPSAVMTATYHPFNFDSQYSLDLDDIKVGFYLFTSHHNGTTDIN